MRARFNADPSPELASRFAEWLAALPRPAPAPVEHDPDPVEPRPRSTRRRPAVGGPLSAASTAALSTVAPAVAALSSFGDVRTPLDEVVRRVQQYLADGSSLAELWDVAGIRPLAQAIDALDPALRSAWHHLDRLTVDEPLSGSPLSLARRPPIAAARAVDLFAYRVRRVIGHLAGVDDAALASAVRRTASQRALCALLLTLNTTPHRAPTVAVDPPLAVPLVDPWRAAWSDAVGLGADEAQLTTVLRVPRLWLGRGGWPALWHTAAKQATPG
jgi:hypothetical protein